MYVFDPVNPPRFNMYGGSGGGGGEDHQPPPSPLLLQQDLAKLSLSEEKPICYSGGWMVPHSPRPAPYILVNPVSPLPQYLPYLYPSYQVRNSTFMARIYHLISNRPILLISDSNRQILI